MDPDPTYESTGTTCKEPENGRFFIEAARLDGVRILSAWDLPKFPAPPKSDGTGTEKPSANLRR
jgi:hypothetical protein